MHTHCRGDGASVAFVVGGLTDAEEAAARALGYAPVDGGFGRSFPAPGPYVERIYRNFTVHVEELLRQKAGDLPVPWERTLEMLLQLVGGRSLNWLLVGSAALAARGLDVMPGDVDMVVHAGTKELEAALLDYAIEPTVPVGWRAGWVTGHAFVHASVTWIGPSDGRADSPEAGGNALEIVAWRGHALPVQPLGTALRDNEWRGREERVALIRHAMRR